MKRRFLLVTLGAVGAGALAAGSRAADPLQKFPDVLSATVQAAPNGGFDFDVTVSSPYDTARRYADAIRARSKDGTTYGVRELLHDHASEQPFTRDLYKVKVPAGIKSVVIEGRDKQFGFGGRTVEVSLPGR